MGYRHPTWYDLGRKMPTRAWINPNVKAYGMLSLKAITSLKRWRKTHELITKGQSQNNSSLEPEIKTKEIWERWSNGLPSALQELQLYRGRLQHLPTDHGLAECPETKEHHVSLGNKTGTTNPRCPLQKWSYQIFSAGLLLFCWNSFLCNSEIKICCCLDSCYFKDTFLILEQLVINSNGSTAIAQQTLNKKQLTYELQSSYLLRRINAWKDNSQFFEEGVYNYFLISPSICVAPQSAVLLKLVIWNAENGNH